MTERSTKYPRGIPYRSPRDEEIDPRHDRPAAHASLSLDDLAALESRMRLRLFLIILTSVAVLVVLGLVGVFYVNQAVRRASAVAAVPASPQESPSVIKPETNTAPLVASERQDRTAEVLGGLTAAHLHQSYLNIGLLADAAENDVYSADEARKLLETVNALIESVDQQLGKMPAELLDAGDQKKLARARQVAGLLRTQAKRLQAYWDTPEADQEKKKEREAEFHQVRQTAWQGIKELLGIGD